jgi:hypothetical protein
MKRFFLLLIVLIPSLSLTEGHRKKRPSAIKQQIGELAGDYMQQSPSLRINIAQLDAVMVESLGKLFEDAAPFDTATMQDLQEYNNRLQSINERIEKERKACEEDIAYMRSFLNKPKKSEQQKKVS